MGPFGIKGEAGEKGQQGEPGYAAVSPGSPGTRGRPGVSGPPGPKGTCEFERTFTLRFKYLISFVHLFLYFYLLQGRSSSRGLPGAEEDLAMQALKE